MALMDLFITSSDTVDLGRAAGAAWHTMRVFASERWLRWLAKATAVPLKAVARSGTAARAERAAGAAGRTAMGATEMAAAFMVRE